MAFWWILVLLITIGSVQPQCFVCSKKCQILSMNNVQFSKTVTIRCNATSSDLSTYLVSYNFTDVNKLSLKTPLLLTLNLTKLSNTSIIDLSENNLDIFNLSIFTNVQWLNLSYNSIQRFNVFYSKLSQLDLSHNAIENITLSNFKLPKLHRLNLSSNFINNMNNFSTEQIKYLDVSNNNIQTLSFGNVSNLKTVDLSNNSITFINPSTFSMTTNLEILNLSSNFIRELKDMNFKLPNLLKLDLKRNKIRTLSQKCFASLSKLQLLDISLNEITNILPSTLQFLPGLVQLIVAENAHLSSKDFGLLLATRRLQHVDASKTGQVKIPSSLTRSVRYLNLQTNNISNIQCGDLDSYPLLNVLDLSNNNISYIEDDALGRLELLTTLILRGNSLNAVPHTLPSNLKNLFLDSNKIKQICTTDFIGLGQLKTLDLSMNSIQSINDGSFSQIKALEILNLSGNAVEILSSSTFFGTHKLKVLDLSMLTNVMKCEQQLCFPVPESNQLQELYLQNSPSLVNRLMNDVAALKTLKQLNVLNMAHSNLSEIRKDLLTLLPRVNLICLQGNNLECSDLAWTMTLIHTNILSDCSFSDRTITTLFTDIHVSELVTEKSTAFSNENLNLIQTTEKNNNLLKDFNLTVSMFGSENITSSENMTINSHNVHNDALFDTSSPGMVYAFSTEMPSSHPGLFIMLLLPIALFSTCLVINYSRLKRNRDNEICFDHEVEISNFSNELW